MAVFGNSGVRLSESWTGVWGRKGGGRIWREGNKDEVIRKSGGKVSNFWCLSRITMRCLVFLFCYVFFSKWALSK